MPRKASGKRRSRRKPPSAKALIEKGQDEIVQALGLDILGLSKEELAEALEPPVSMVLGASKPSIEALIKRLKRHLPNVYSMIAAYILENRDRLTVDQLEFIAAYGGRVAAGAIDRLYEEARRLGREDLIPMLITVWEKYGKPSPVKCPRCGFRAVAPDLTCTVCGHLVSEENARRQLGFEDLVKVFAETADERSLKEALETGVVYVTSTGVWSLRLAPRERPGVVIGLSEEEKRVIRERLRGRS